MRYLIVILLCGLVACSHNKLGEPKEVEKSSLAMVKSFKTLGVTEFNNIIDMAISNGKDWPFSPALIAFNIFGGDKESRTYLFSQEADSIENPSIVTSVIIRDGFADDAVRGDWHKIYFSIKADNTWRIAEIKKAYSCWREDSGEYRAPPCP